MTYGIDFFCSVFRKANTQIEEMTGAVLAVQVRSTSVEDKQRIKLDRADAETALRIDNPYVLIGIDIIIKKVYFRFMDEALVEELQTFLQSDNDSRSWPLDSLGSGNDHFTKLLTEVCRPAYQQKLRWKRTELDISAVVPGSRLTFSQDKHGGIAVITAPFFTDFLVIEHSQQEKMARIIFNEGHLGSIKQSLLHPKILSLTDLIDGPICIGGSLEQEGSISIEYPGISRVTIPVGIRKIGDEIGFILRTGLYLIVSGARNKKGQWVHEFRHGIATKDTFELVKSTEEFKFLKALREGATLFLSNESPISIDHWGNLKYLGPDLEAMEKVFAHLQLSLSDLHLADVVELPALMTIGVINAFRGGIGIEHICPGFVYEQAIEKKLQDRNWKLCGFRIPIVMNLKSFGIIIWSSGKGSVYKVNNLICGFRPEQQERWEFEIRDQAFPKVTIPELRFYKAWTPIPLNVSDRMKCESLEFEAELPFGGEIYEL